MDGIETLKRIREKGDDVDIILITAAQEGNIIKEVMRFGAFDYIIKPFTFERVKAALDSYRQLFERINFGTPCFNQKDVDRTFIPKVKNVDKRLLPKGLQHATLHTVVNQIKKNERALSAEEIANLTGISRVTARRYLEYLVSCGRASVEPHYQKVGRPINKYKLLE